jgi:hypothetical protein
MQRVIDTVRLADFLRPVQLTTSHILPIVHSTEAANVYSIISQDRLVPASGPDFFNGKHLLYFFVGRPAYKSPSSDTEAAYWECPLVFVLHGPDGVIPKSIYPFDTGAFLRKGLPSYISLFELERFSLGSAPDMIGKLITVFFGTEKNYIRGVSRAAEELKAAFALTPRHQEIEALIRLYNDRLPILDDRAKCIELQVAQEVKITDCHLVAVIMPAPYSSDDDLMNVFERLNCKVETYDVLPLRVSNYHALIYKKLERIIEGLV